ncbi:hypothetical protein ID866_5046 [Astraeus odoratus]|nr:hypothetical protein ID866_5046 [Astraeus odoratus]
MAYHSFRYDDGHPTPGFTDPFSDSARDEPFRPPDLPRDDSKTFTTSTSGVLASEPPTTLPGSNVTEAQLLATDYRQQNASPPSVGERLSVIHSGARSSTPSILDTEYRDDDAQSTVRPTSAVAKADEVSLVYNAADMGKSVHYQDLDYAEPSSEEQKTIGESKKADPWQRFLGTGKYPLEQRIENKKRGIGRQKYPFVVWALTITMIGVFVNELVVNARAQGSPLSFKPVVNPMLGPSESALINLGARFPPCMKSVANLSSSTLMPCLNDTANPPTSVCTIEEVCGFGGFGDGAPNQWYRFITAIFLHAGIIHILLNMLAQLTLSAQIEREMGSGGFLVTYFAAGIFGNVLGGNFALVGTPSVGASGAIFGTVAVQVTWVDLFAHWKYHYQPWKRFAWMTVELLFGIALGYIPYVDNFAHLGGLCMGLLVGTTLYPVISPTRRHRTIMWAFRIAAIPLAVLLFVVLIRNFYTSDPYADRLDPNHCDSLLTKGTWLDDAHRNWQPEGESFVFPWATFLHFRCRLRVVFVGDSVTRTLYFQFIHLVDPRLPNAPTDDGQKHADYSFDTESSTTLDFIWDPFLNTSSTLALIDPQDRRAGNLQQPPALLVLGSGLWYLRYADTSGGLPAWEAMVEAHIDAISTARVKIADRVVFLPVEDVVTSKLSPDRHNTMHSSDIDAMNSDLYHRIKPSYTDSLWQFVEPSAEMPVSLPLVFNKLLDDSLTEDGLHFSNSVVQVQANILLNLRCNNDLSVTPPMDKTCCRAYPWPSGMQLVILTVIAVYTGISVSRLCASKGWTNNKDNLPVVVFGLAVCIIYLADRTGLWLKEQKQFNPWTFAFLCFASLAVGLVTVHRSDKDLGFLNRDQSDEWKGWMQIAILIYHYFGASKVSGIYNPIRVLVAAYLFMTGYGHTTFYLKKADFGFLRIAQVMVRLNLLTVALVYTMNADYLSYYFTPLVSMWFLIIYTTMVIGSQFNGNVLFLVCKIFASMTIFAIFMHQGWLLELFFEVLKQVFNINWSAREWTFRVTLDQYIVYFGMLAAVLAIKVREHHLTDHYLWPTLVKMTCGCSIVIILWFFGFELAQESKFTYNAWHPYISFLPISAFVILRNANQFLRSCTSRAFAFIGKCSLETFIIQFHFWLAADTKGVLLVVPGTRWRPLNFLITSFVFIYVSHHVAWASGEITSWVCSQREKTLPTTSETVPLASAGADQSSLEEERCAPGYRSPIQPQRWAEILMQNGHLGVKGKVTLATMFMWIANIFWPHS